MNLLVGGEKDVSVMRTSLRTGRLNKSFGLIAHLVEGLFVGVELGMNSYG